MSSEAWICIVFAVLGWALLMWRTVRLSQDIKNLKNHHLRSIAHLEHSLRTIRDGVNTTQNMGEKLLAFAEKADRKEHRFGVKSRGVVMNHEPPDDMEIPY